jgi:hypothetical protein
MSTSFITPGHVRAFRAVTTQLYGEVALMSCLINRKPGVAIVLMDHVGEGKIGVMPLFFAITDDMNVTFEGEGGDGGGAVLTGNSKPTRMRPVLRTTFRKRRAPAGPAAGALPVIDGPLTDEDSARPSQLSRLASALDLATVPASSSGNRSLGSRGLRCSLRMWS